MSTRAKDMLLEDLDALGPVKIKDVEAAQQQVINTIRQLEQQGVVSLRGSVGEQYVV
jgi:flagellar motor switch protein FliG